MVKLIQKSQAKPRAKNLAPLAPRQLKFRIKTWGGKRAGAGRKNKSGAVNHMARQEFSARHPLHVTMRLKKGLTGLRSKAIHVLFQTAIREMKKFGVHVNHHSLQGNHFHIILEAKTQAALARAMKSFGCRFGKGVKKHLNLSNTQIFYGRYHVTILKNPTQTRNALRYVLLNQAQHSKLTEHIDLYSSGFYFSHWPKLIGRKYAGLIAQQSEKISPKISYLDLPHYLRPPQTWLLREGWMKAAAIHIS